MKTLQLVLCIALAGVLFACDRNTTYVEQVAGPAACTDCHNDTNLITAKHTQWALSRHGSGDAYERGTSASCAGCHSGYAFVERVAAGLDPNELTEGDPAPTRQDCRTCHMIHESFTKDDFALRTTQPVTMFAVANATFDGGKGNLCVNCHQPRRDAPVANGSGMVTGISGHWGPHHGPQSAMLMGVAGAIVAPGMASGHYNGIDDTCVHCHLGSEDNHTFEPEVATCVPCHPGATDFDVNNVQTDVQALLDQLGDELVSRGLIDQNTPDGHPIVSSAPAAEGYALWNWIYIAHEDKSLGVHTADYTKALLQASLDALTPPPAPVAQSARRAGNGGSR
jgi:hypothetical protein